MARKSIEKQIAELKFDAKIYAAHQRRLLHGGEPLLQNLSKAQFATLYHISDGFQMLGLSIDDGLRLGMRNRLPQTLQDHYAQMRVFSFPNDKAGVRSDADIDMEREADRYPLVPSLDERYPRWRPDYWRCPCGEDKTLWHKTPFNLKDRNQIYCAGCRTLSGWGTDQAFKGAHAKGEAARIVITHPLDREAFTPPLIVRRPHDSEQNPVRAKRSQRLSSRKLSLRAKRSQRHSSTQDPVHAKQSQSERRDTNNPRKMVRLKRSHS